MRPIKSPALACGVAYIGSILLLGPLLGSTADSSTAYADHYDSDANVLRDLAGSMTLLIVAACITWTAITARRLAGWSDTTKVIGDLTAASGLVSSGAIVVAAGLLATVPLTTLIGDLTDDPGIDVTVQAGIAQAGSVVLFVAMIAVALTTVLLARLGRATGAVPQWIVTTAWMTAGTLLLGASVVLLFPFGVWIIATGMTWRREDDPTQAPSRGARGEIPT